MNHKNRSRWFCKPCDKTAYGSESRAYGTAAWAEEDHGHTNLRAYQCQYGNGWHLTSKEFLK